MSEYPSYLIHHGVPGQKWGYRRWQNEDGSLTPEGREHYGRIKENGAYVLKKGSTVNRVSTLKKEKLKGNKYLYTDVDKDVYEGAFSTYLKYAYPDYSGNSRKIYKKTYIAKEDLIAPTEKKAKQILDNRLYGDKKLLKKVASHGDALLKSDHPSVIHLLQDNNVKLNEIPEKYRKNDLGIKEYSGAYDAYMKLPKEKQEKINRDLTFLAYNSMVEFDKKELNNFLKDVSKKGYNAIMDYNNMKIYNDAAEPFIAINSKKTLREIDNKLLEDKYIEEAVNRLENKMKKKGRLVAL